MADFDEDTWRQPTEAEAKVIAARQERSDKISKIMSGYLLKGYRMLATSCSECDTIELRDKQGRIYCVACSEVDVDDNSKDNPVLSAQAATHQIAEQVRRSVESVPASASGVCERQLGPRLINSIPELPQGQSLESVVTFPSSDALQTSLSVVIQKLESATEGLRRSDNPEKNEFLIAYIKSCADCITAIKRAQKA